MKEIELSISFPLWCEIQQYMSDAYQVKAEDIKCISFTKDGILIITEGLSYTIGYFLIEK